MNEHIKTIAKNKKAYFDYFVLSTYEAGIELLGTEVKSLRCGSVNMKDSFCEIEKGEIFIRNMHISPYEKGNIFNREPLRPKKLLMHKREIIRLFSKVKEDGPTKTLASRLKKAAELMSFDDAEKIARLLKKNPETDIVVHCDAGIDVSRGRFS